MKKLRSGFTTGSCAAAAAKAAAILFRDGVAGNDVSIPMPGGERASFPVASSATGPCGAICSVIKDAGDDPDVTNGAEIAATVTVETKPGHVTINGGRGIGRITKPGLALPPGEWAINPVPRIMITEAIREVFPQSTVQVTISIEDGEQRALKTLNSRLGIIGGLSILGTTGVVRPISAKAWTDTIDASLDVARACGCRTVVLCTGRTSELAAMGHLSALSEESFIMMGDHVRYALDSCARHGFHAPVLACQFAKLVKIACGHPNTHAAASDMDLAQLRNWLADSGDPNHLTSLTVVANTAREIIVSSGYDPILVETVCLMALKAAKLQVPELSPTILLCRYDGTAPIPFSR